MRAKRILGAVAATLLAVSFAGSAMAADPTASTNVSLTITAGTQFSVAITDSNNFPNQPFSLANNPGNFSYSAHYNLQVIDGRGSGAGWIVTAGASAFIPTVLGGGLPDYNNGLSWLPCAAVTGFCATPGSISAGVTVVPGSPDIMAAPASIFAGQGGTQPGPVPNATGTFSTQEVVYYTGFPVAAAAGTYSTTITLTLAGSNP